jgi:quercetin dioxygenase-like cupin family protein
MNLTAHLPTPVRLPALAAHHNKRVVYALFVFTASAVSIGLITTVAYLSGHLLVVPSLGPTAFLVFNRSQSAVARPRNILLGHLIGAVAGYAALVAFGLQHAPSVSEGGVSSARIGAAALSIALTAATMILLRAEHGPAAATTLIVSLGFMTTPAALGLLMTGVVSLAALGVLIDRAVGLRMPLWAGPERAPAARRLGRLVPWPSAPSAGKAQQNGHGVSHAPPAAPAKAARRRYPSWVIGPGQGRRVQVGTETCTVKVQDAHSADVYSVVEVVFDPAQPSTLLHAHYDFAETYYVLEGEILAEVGTQRQKVPAGSTISMPVGVAHLLSAAGRRPARCLCITNRAQHSDLEYLP